MNNPNPNVWLTVREAAEYLRISPRQIWRLISAGKITPKRIGRNVRIRQSDLDAL